jgi:type II secretory pathway pseudopilin PulG
MAARARRQEAGFTYIGLIVFVTIIGLVGAATLKVGALLQRAEAEHELLEIGAEFSAALRSYALATPKGQPPQPTSLEALLRDPRFPNPRRHLRRIFVDPMTGKAEWGLVAPAEGGPIMGVYSLSQAQPLKIGNFDSRFVNFENKKHLSDWKFTPGGQGVSSRAAAMPGAAASPEVTMFPQSPDIPNAPVAAPVQEQQVLRELEPPPKTETAEPEPVEEVTPPATTAPPEEETDETTERKPAAVPTDQ